MKGRGLLAISGLFLLACGARSNDTQVRGAWQYHEDSVTYNITFADNHAFVETMAHVDEPVTGNWRVEGNHLIITTGLKNDSQSPSSDTSEIVKLDESSMILKSPPDSLNRKLKTLFRVK
jgi:hypothetical protein